MSALPTTYEQIFDAMVEAMALAWFNRVRRENGMKPVQELPDRDIWIPRARDALTAALALLPDPRTSARRRGTEGMTERTLPERLRDIAADARNPSGDTMNHWDKIRHQVETRKGSDLPRLNFEGLIETFAEALDEAADALDALASPAPVYVEGQKP